MFSWGGLEFLLVWLGNALTAQGYPWSKSQQDEEVMGHKGKGLGFSSSSATTLQWDLSDSQTLSFSIWGMGVCQAVVRAPFWLCTLLTLLLVLLGFIHPEKRAFNPKDGYWGGLFTF